MAQDGWERPAPEITEEQKKQLMATALENGTNAWDYVQSWEKEVSKAWIAAGILSCIRHGYNLNRLMICWEARELRYDESKRRK